MRFCIDIDGTICHTNGLSYEEAEPIVAVVDSIKDLKRNGHYVILFTARGSGTGIDHFELTKKQMDQWGVPYDELLLGKPFADIYIDDKAFLAADWHRDLVAYSENSHAEHIAEKHAKLVEYKI